MKQNQLLMKIALLSVCLVTGSLNIIAGNIPAMAQSMANVPLSMIELATTIPSLSSMLAILTGAFIIKLLGYKKTMLLGLMLAGLGGGAPFFLSDITLILITRAILGFGIGLIDSVALNMIIALFTGNDVSLMMGLQGSVAGGGSLVETFVAGQLLAISWHASFIVYTIVAVLSFLLFMLFVPDVQSTQGHQNINSERKATSKDYLSVIGLSFLLFISGCIAMFFVIKCSTLMTLKGYASETMGSYAVMCISAGSLVAGSVYATIYTRLKAWSLPLFYGLTALGFLIGGLANSFILMCVGAFLVGFGYLAFMPYIKQRVTMNYGVIGAFASTFVLIMQYLGSFAVPYYGMILNAWTSNLTAQFFINASGCVLLLIIACFMAFHTSTQKRQ